MPSRLTQLHDAGQAVWLDYVDRKFLKEGGLRKLVEEDHLTGVTSNPSIFEKAMGHGEAYNEGFTETAKKGDESVTATYEAQAIRDIQDAADTLRPVYDRLGGKDGYVSLEVSPHLADETQLTIDEARRLWNDVDRANLMIKVPGTEAGVPAIRQLIEDGLNINVTLLFAIDAYKKVAMAFVEGLEARVAKGEPIERIASVASFFLSRIDTRIDDEIDARVKNGDNGADSLKGLKGKVAIANAKLAYAWYQELIASDRWRELADKGAMPQRLLWASTSIKNPDYRDVLYIEKLIGPDTVSTMPPKTMDAFRDHGEVAETLAHGVDEARRTIDEANRLGLDVDGVTQFLVHDGVKQFADAADALLGAVADKRAKLLGDKLNGFKAKLPGDLQKAIDDRLDTARKQHWGRKLWDGDASLWTGNDEGKWIGWLRAAEGKQVDHDQLTKLADTAKHFKDAVLLGMGGSSLGPEVIARILGNRRGHAALHVLDTTDPGQIATVRDAIDPTKTLFFVSSKSGSTMEPELLREYFFDLSGKQGDHFVAVTDPGSDLEKVAKRDGFAGIFFGDPAIGGRYSVLSVFGMAPAAAMGIDVGAFLNAIQPMVRSCAADAPPAANPGIRLGAIIGEAARVGRNKLTIVSSESLKPLGSWLEQLLAESTGKQGKGIVPVDLEPLGAPEDYGDDRLFAHFHLEGDDDAELRAKLDALAAAGQPVVTMRLALKELIGQEFVRWEVATAIAGAVIGIDPFNQPDVEDTKVATRMLVDAYEQRGSLDKPEPAASDGPVKVFATGDPSMSLNDPKVMIATHLARLQPGDYLGFLAYVERDDAHEDAIKAMRVRVRDAKQVATVAGFGPRFLHSAGQAYKGGPKSGVFITITRDPANDIAIPGHRASFGVVQLAQAEGDMKVLADRGQRVIRVHLADDDLSRLAHLIDAALKN
ncbi:bifunctional transaldolase/phosoglucose isomerase [Sphingopyxis sp. SE2]|uniref:bifunctional transaldolase/phosoglucose isomerase n=1 Tax=Sphingopyxis sp. SE2 TaxID=1586240 RepID=UPI0028C37166|nr:bifunctional transaldolase/phosoglucose isomerase [Sphingopyxis sp. SE2]MDT7531221.1 bifunctional transaldolase/phosoglucose isomerase [Sphingopyxis sp. SE2]